MEVGVVEICLFAVTLLLLLYQFLKARRPSNFPPGPPTLPIIGNLHQLGNEPHKTFIEMGKTYGDIFSIYFAGYPAVVLNDYKDIKEAFAEPVFSGRATFLKPFRARTGGVPRGVIFTHDKVWMEQRRFALKTLRDFGFGKKSMEATVSDEVVELIESFKKTVGQPIQTQNKFNAAVLNALWSLVTGQRYSQDDPLLLDLIKRLTSTISQSRAAGAILFFPIIFTLRRLLMLSKAVRERKETQEKTVAFMKDNIDDHLKTFQEDATPRDFIDAYLQEIKKASSDSSFFDKEGLENLKYTMLDLFIAGAETTSTTLTWEFLLLALNPQKQQKMYEEIKSVVGTSRLPSLSDRVNMPYTEATIMEVMRFSAMVPTGVFHSTLEDVEFRGFKIPKNTIVVPNLYKCMRDSKTWGDGDAFRPERFLSADGKSVVKHEALLPFSTGRRVCLGETLARDELFLFTSALFQRFRVAENPEGPKISPFEYISAAVLIPKTHDVVLHDRDAEETS